MCAQLERKYRDIVDEKELLHAEVFRLKDDLKRKEEPGLSRYNPNSPTALQRKIGENIQCTTYYLLVWYNIQ